MRRPACFAALLLIGACKGEPPAAKADAAPRAAATPSDAARPYAPPADANPASLDRQLGEAGFGKAHLGEQGPYPGAVFREIEVVSGDAFPGDIGGKLDYAYWDGVKACYLAGLKKQSGIAGRVVVTFTVGKTGRVTKAEVAGFDHGIDACIQKRALGWSFHLETPPATFKVPFELNLRVPPRPID